jgi:hypothetical protein
MFEVKYNADLSDFQGNFTFFESKIPDLRFEILEKEGYSGHIGADIPRKYLLSHPTDRPTPGGGGGETGD